MRVTLTSTAAGTRHPNEDFAGAGLTGAALLSNGASRVVDRFGLTDWPGLLALLASSGPSEVVRRVREAEERYGVTADDATVVHCTDLGAA